MGGGHMPPVPPRFLRLCSAYGDKSQDPIGKIYYLQQLPTMW